MKKEERKKQLEKLAKSSMGKALGEMLDEKIRELRDGRNYNRENFEIEGKASIKAALKLEQIKKHLTRLNQDKKEKQDNPYV